MPHYDTTAKSSASKVNVTEQDRVHAQKYVQSALIDLHILCEPIFRYVLYVLCFTWDLVFRLPA